MFLVGFHTSRVRTCSVKYTTVFTYMNEENNRYNRAMYLPTPLLTTVVISTKGDNKLIVFKGGLVVDY